jgi:hypothetical protein
MEWRFYDIFYFVCQSKDMTPPILGRFWKKHFFIQWQFYTVTQDEYELRKAAHMFDWWWGVEGGLANV